DATSGANYLALGDKNWLWEESTLTRQEVSNTPVGQWVSDPDALDGQALQAITANDPVGIWQSDAITFSEPQPYRAYVRLKAGSNSLADEVVRLEIIAQSDGDVIGLRRLRGVDFREAGTYQEFHVDFDTATNATSDIKLYITFLDKTDIALDRFIIMEYPTAFTTNPTYSTPSFRLKVIDGAGNVSNDLLVDPSFSPNSSVYIPLVIKN
ncbi:MAG: hypothetical protein KDJ65_33670, partial [Anaerolineae bacterium]|nr:hypothetical protein [Anaerolineae bacterium]